MRICSSGEDSAASQGITVIIRFAALDRFISTKFSISALSQCDLNQPRRSALRAAPSSHASNLRTSFVTRIAITRKLLCDHRAPLCRYLLGRRKAKWSRCSPRISVSLPHLHAVARQLRRPSPEASSIADAALATSFVDSNCGYPDHRIVRWPRSAAERYNLERG